MAQLNGKGPDDKGSEAGRGLGKCFRNKDLTIQKFHLGQGMGKRRKAGLVLTKIK
ncbi:MAG: hypothetical protein GZ091_02275 [Paludibacter sp.]|nr:hypothetical protein [Paludibacter sp.]